MKITTIESAIEIIKIGITANQVDEKMTTAIKDDVLKSGKDGKSQFTKALDKMLKETNGKPEERKEVTQFVRKKLQTLIKSKQTQTAILGKEGAKSSKVTIKKVSKPMCDNDEDFFNLNNEPLLFNELDDLKSMRVIVERKEQAEPKTFQEELIKLLDKFGEDTLSLLNFSAKQGGAEVFKDGVEQTFKANGLDVEIKLKK